MKDNEFMLHALLLIGSQTPSLPSQLILSTALGPLHDHAPCNRCRKQWAASAGRRRIGRGLRPRSAEAAARRRRTPPLHRSLRYSKLRAPIPCRSVCMAMRSWCRSCLLLRLRRAAGRDGCAPAAGDTLPSETPAAFTPHVESFDYVKREVMIPMRDGVKLQTLILIPRGAHRAPILLTRTPYGATERIAKSNSAHLTALIDSTDVADDAVVNGGYIRVMQDVRGKHGSEGDYVMTRPLQGPLESDRRGSLDGHLRHHRLAGEERSRIQRQGRDSRHLVRRLHLTDGAGQSASGAARGGSDQRHGRRLDGGRLVSSRAHFGKTA